jgi:DNA-3-methyladenine glycosylase II
VALRRELGVAPSRPLARGAGLLHDAGLLDRGQGLRSRSATRSFAASSASTETRARHARRSFQTLARSIVGQQISVKAAQSIWDRFHAAAGGMKPRLVLALEEPRLRECGLSRAKPRTFATWHCISTPAR